jgi:spermidine synthase
VLEALIEHMQQEAEKPLLPIVRNEHLSAIEKLQRFFSVLDSSRTTQKAFLANLARVWFADDNAIVRTKVDAAIIERRTPLLREIIHQGRREGVFNTPYPDQAGEMILVLSGGMGSTLVKLMLAAPQEPVVDEIVTVYSAYAGAIERVLGASHPFLPRPDRASVQEWLNVDDKPIH